MKKYKQLNLEERVTIKILLQQGNSIREIAKEMGRSPSTIHREICRGITVVSRLGIPAQQKYL